MTGDVPNFRRPRAPWTVGVAPLLAALVVLGGVVLLRAWGEAGGAPAGVLIEVRGDVPKPGWHRIDPPSLDQALQAAGDTRRTSATPLHEGDLVQVSDEGVAIHPKGNPLLVGVPVDLNDAPAEVLETVPGIGPHMASAIVADRLANGPFYAVADLGRVRGVGDKKVSEIAPLLTVGEIGPRPPPRPMDINAASAAELERLPGIGPTLAARIVVDRDERGRYRRLDDLLRVRGITASTLARLRDHAEAR